MPNFLLWNTHGNQISDQVIALAIERSADIIVLAECELAIPQLIDSLNTTSSRRYESSLGGLSKRKLVFIHNSMMRSFHLIRDSSLGSFGVFNTGVGDEIIIAGVHFPSKRDRDRLDHEDFAEQFRKTLEEVEKERGHSRSVVVGDLNMNPFEDGMIAAKYLHAVMDQDIAKKSKRKANGRYYKYLYNPMWGKMGDLSLGPPGT